MINACMFHRCGSCLKHTECARTSCLGIKKHHRISYIMSLTRKNHGFFQSFSLPFLDLAEANDGLWNLITYCAATGGSLLVIGSAAGVAFMGLERKVSFGWCLGNAISGGSRGRHGNYICISHKSYMYIYIYIYIIYIYRFMCIT